VWKGVGKCGWFWVVVQNRPLCCRCCLLLPRRRPLPTFSNPSQPFPLRSKSTRYHQERDLESGGPSNDLDRFKSALATTNTGGALVGVRRREKRGDEWHSGGAWVWGKRGGGDESFIHHEWHAQGIDIPSSCLSPPPPSSLPPSHTPPPPSTSLLLLTVGSSAGSGEAADAPQPSSPLGSPSGSTGEERANEGGAGR
jgi:hypothetical protein